MLDIIDNNWEKRNIFTSTKNLIYRCWELMSFLEWEIFDILKSQNTQTVIFCIENVCGKERWNI